jgi:tetratricopeptide (TPR) repeat protein
LVRSIGKTSKLMKKQIVLLIFILLTGSISVLAQNPKQYLKVGDEFLENRKFQDAIDQYTKAIDIDPDFDKAYLSRARAYESVNNYAEAVEDYNTLSIFDEGNEEYYYRSARMYLLSKEYEKALGKVNVALDKKKVYPEAQQLKVTALIELERYNEALAIAKEALKYRESEINFFNYGKINELVGLYDEAEDGYEKAIKKNKSFLDAYASLANLQRERNNLTEALKTINEALEINHNFAEGYRVRSLIYADQLKYSEAINDVSTILLMQPENTDMYFQRAKFYQGYAQHMNAITDFSKVISIDPKNAAAYYNRAFSFEQIMRYDDAIKDYKKLAEVAENDDEALELLAQAEGRLYELNRESDKPSLTLTNPVEQEGRTLFIPRSENIIPIVGKARDASKLKSIEVNDMNVPFTLKKDAYEFLTSINLAESNQVIVSVTDEYDNTETVAYNVLRTEIDPPEVRIIAPYASDNDIIYLDSNDPNIYVEGTITDESLIKSIYINDVVASYVPDDLNPNFQAMLNVANKDQFTVKVTDNFGNVAEQTFTLNRESANIAADNPMGKTWVVFVENSKYESFASLEGPTKDITLMKTALAKYTVHNFIHKKDMSKQELERFFAIELRDLLRSNRVNSLLVWYAGHGKFVNETGYWVPVDAKRDDEFTYFNINALKASMQSYPTNINHTLVITDACESGPSFYQAMRSGLQERNCNDWATVKLKSSQVFSSAGYELAVDNSQFTRTFANVLANNPDACMPIESVVQKVTDAVVKSNQQKPQFGKIAGLEDENGTFFFIAK